MIVKMFAVYDKAVEAFMPPFTARSNGEAMRMFMESVKRNEQFQAHHRDYALYYLADWNDSTGDFGVADEDKLAVPRLVMSGVDAVQVFSKEAANPELNGRLAPSMVNTAIAKELTPE